MRVKWETDVDAETPEEAARQALTIQRRPDSTATVFDVTDEVGNTVRVDLDEGEAEEIVVCDDCGKRCRAYRPIATACP